METLKAIATRRSVREFLDKPVPDEVVHAILRAGMSGPSSANKRPWSFVVVRSHETLCKMADGSRPYAEMLRHAAFAILVCGDESRFIAPAPEYWVIDGAIAGQNMILAAHDLGVGSVWIGTYPQREKMDAQARILGLPEGAVAHSVIAFGYPKNAEMPERDLYEADRVHFEKW